MSIEPPARAWKGISLGLHLPWTCGIDACGRASPFKMVAQKVERSDSTGVYQPCFDRVEGQTVFFYPAANLL